MKLTYLLPLFAFVILAGCSSHGDESASRPDPNTNLPPDQKIEKIQNDSKIPDGLKQIQIETLQHQPGAKR